MAPLPLPPASQSFYKKLVDALNELRTQKKLCDIVIKVDGRAFHAHRAVLAARSEYFMAMLTSGFKGQ